MSSEQMAALCRKSIGPMVTLLHHQGMSYKEIEVELRLRPNNGMTAWRLEGKKHQPPPVPET